MVVTLVRHCGISKERLWATPPPPVGAVLFCTHCPGAKKNLADSSKKFGFLTRGKVLACRRSGWSRVGARSSGSRKPSVTCREAFCQGRRERGATACPNPLPPVLRPVSISRTDSCLRSTRATRWPRCQTCAGESSFGNQHLEESTLGSGWFKQGCCGFSSRFFPNLTRTPMRRRAVGPFKASRRQFGKIVLADRTQTPLLFCSM